MPWSSSLTPDERCCCDNFVYKSGKVILRFRIEAGGTANTNYTKFIGTNFKNDSQNWGNSIKSVLPTRREPLFVSGPAGNSKGLNKLTRLKSVLEPECQFVNPKALRIATNWDPTLTPKSSDGQNGQE